MEIQGLASYKERFNIKSKQTIEPGLANIERALQQLGNPHKQLHVIHVAGTNGKGSTVGFLEQLALQRELKTGVFTSPAFIDVHDQIRVNGAPMTEAQMNAAMEQIARANVSDLTDFELVTVAMFVALAQAKVDVAIIEAGMGGLLDATNVVKPLVSVVTTIAIEHTQFLGDTLSQIAEHKAGIFKFGAAAVIGALQAEAAEVMAKTATAKRMPLYTFGKDFTVENGRYTFGDITFDPLQPSLKGAHQQHNMALAITAFVLFCEKMKVHVAAKRVQAAVANTHVPYRFEQIAPNVYVDGAHNVAAAQVLVQTIEEQLGGRVHIVLGMLRDKDVAGVIRVLQPVAKSFSFMTFSHERALPAEDMQAYVDGNVIASLQEIPQDGTPVVVTGSLYLLAACAK